MISPEKQSNHFVPMKAAVWEAVSAILKSCVPGQKLRKDLQFAAAALKNQGKKLKNGFSSKNRNRKRRKERYGEVSSTPGTDAPEGFESYIQSIYRYRCGGADRTWENSRESVCSSPLGTYALWAGQTGLTKAY